MTDAPHLIIREPGFMTSVQDAGRFGYLNQGVPVSGPVDPIALRLANRLVGNDEKTAGLEIGFFGPVLEIAADSVRLALAGGPAAITVDGEPRPANAAFVARRGQLVRFGPVSGATVAVIAIAGGFDLPLVMGSLSTYGRAGFGGLEGRNLKEGDRLPLTADSGGKGALLAVSREVSVYGEGPIRVVLGPQEGHFTEAALATFLSEPYRIGQDADRMGLRLEGSVLEHNEKGYNIASDGIAAGAIQVPGNGLPIILMVDHQSAGGYPKIATVASADLPRLGRLMPGSMIRFTDITVKEAEKLRRDQEKALQRVFSGLKPRSDSVEIDLAALSEENLISGLVYDTGIEVKAEGG